MVDPKIMCDQHLLGEHLETHMFLGSLKKNTKLDGYADSNCLELLSLKDRHDSLVKEMESRGMKHNSRFDTKRMISVYSISQSTKVKQSKIDSKKSRELLLSRCPDCLMKSKEVT